MKLLPTSLSFRNLSERKTISRPDHMVPLAFLVGIIAGTILLSLPVARAGGLAGVEAAPLMTALFTATSAFCVTGLTVVDTQTYWSPFGHVVILLLSQIGGLGIMTGATLLGLLVSKKMPLRNKLMASAEMKSLDLGDVRRVLTLVIIMTLAAEAGLAVWLAIRFIALDMSWPIAIWQGLFHAVSAFMNSGFTILPEGLTPYRHDGWVLVPLMIGVIFGGIGFPVLHELRHEWRVPRRWSIHTKLTLIGSLGLIILGMLLFLLFEWHNEKVFGLQFWGSKILNATFHSVMTRSGGFSTFDIAALGPDSVLVSTFLMMIGGGSASTAGGIRITTFLLLGFVVWSEVRGREDSIAFNRRISPDVQRHALALVLMSLSVVSLALLLLVSFVEAPVEILMFEVISAFATVGLSAGISAEMPAGGQAVLIAMMYIGRVGILSFVTRLALKAKGTSFRYPEERPIVG